LLHCNQQLAQNEAVITEAAEAIAGDQMDTLANYPEEVMANQDVAEAIVNQAIANVNSQA
jgi:hypothetical protein